VLVPLLKDEALLADIAAPVADENELRIWWLGQSGFLLRHSGSLLLFDPYLSDSLTDKYANTDKPHVRMTERVVAPGKLRGIDVVTASHNHTDHLDAATLNPLRAENPRMRLVAPEANRSFVALRLGCDPGWPVGLDDGASVDVEGWRFTGIAAAHNTIDRDAVGRCQFLGFVVKRAGWTIYHSGDSLVYDGLAGKLRACGPIDVALVPINGNRPERRVAGNMDGTEAAKLSLAIGARIAVPHHYEMFEFNTAHPWDLFAPECERLAQPYRVLRAGEGWSVPPRR
jgi:L-ascorbate metabolism protein UlaG (beta-lactamase superfamily)